MSKVEGAARREEGQSEEFLGGVEGDDLSVAGPSAPNNLSVRREAALTICSHPRIIIPLHK
jgi:hypothetical protein